MFKGIVITKENHYQAALTEVAQSMLPEGDVILDVHYSTLNYKDGLAITGINPVVRSFPMIPGIDLAGCVTQSQSPRFKVGDTVLLNGFGVGERHWGGLAQKARLNSDWLIQLPKGLSAKEVMMIGTAGYTAMLSIIALESNGLTPEKGPILVTGANGGVGSFAIGLLARLGYQVSAATGRVNEADYLKQLGAVEIIDRAELSGPGKPLQKERWAGAIDSVGSHTLANVCASISYGGTVAACGLAQGMDFPSSVAPFILRGITLAGIDSVMRPLADREVAWARLAQIINPELLALICPTEIGLEQVIPTIDLLMAGKIRGRVVVKI